LAWLEPEADQIHKVSIIPRGRALGMTLFLPEEDRVNICESSLQAFLLIDMGGRAAEKLVFNEFSAGAENDLSHAMQIARRMVTHWGMSERLGPVAFRDSEDHPFLGREITEPRRFSEDTARVIDEEVTRILRTAYERAIELITQHRAWLDCIAQALEKEETLDDVMIEKLIGPPAWKLAEAATANGKPAAADPALLGGPIGS
jgi:cell division protease FtsH